ncbi:MAG: hypothetical protein IIW79_04775 [Clostridia bacterium]|nr:hypothetical protein [Clostridia bacterium]
MKKLILVCLGLITLISFPLNCYADEDGFGSVYDIVPDNVKDTLNDSDYQIESLQDVIDIISNEGIFSLVKIAFSDYSLPFETVATLVLILTINCSLQLLIDKPETKKIAQIICSLIICVIIAEPLKNIIISVTDCLNSSGVFMFSFLPIFASFLVTTNPGTSAVAYTATTYFFSELTVFISRSVLTPLSTCMFTMSVVSSVSDGIFNNLISGVKKLIIWTLGLVTSIFTAITSVQSIITSAADTVAIKTGKFIVGSSVPVVGGYVSEVMNTIIGSLTVMRSGIGLFAIIVMIIMFLPVTVELLMWKIGVKLCQVISCGTENEIGQNIINAFDDVITVMLSITICVFIGIVLSISSILVFGGVK